MESKDLTVVIVTFKSENKILSCIDSIPKDIDIIIVENSNNLRFKERIEKSTPMLIVFYQERIKDMRSQTILA